MSGEKGAYHSNLTWMRNFIIQDDNFGPYFFVPWEKLLDRLMMFVVPLPGDFDKTPLSAERQAFLAIQTMKMQYLKDYDKGSLLKDNEFWADRFLRNQYVLRPRFITSNELLKKYQGHSLQTKIAEFVANRNQDWYAEIEISWPDLYCYHRENIGCIIVDPYQTSTRPTFPLIHFPGVGYFSNKKGNIEKEIVGHPDGPRQHAIPSKKELI